MGRVKLTDCILVREYSSKLIVRVIVEAVSWQMQKKKSSSVDVWVSISTMIWIRSLQQCLIVVRKNFKSFLAS